MNTSVPVDPTTHTCSASAEFEQWVCRLQFRFGLAQETNAYLFHTAPSWLWDTFLNQLPAYAYQEHKCMACANFMKRYGNLVYINEAGQAQSALWDLSDTSSIYFDAVRTIKHAVERAQVRDVFFTTRDSLQLGHGPADGWSHLMLKVHPTHLSVVADKAASQVNMRNRFLQVNRTLKDYSIQVLNTAQNLILSESLGNTEKIKGPIEWLLNLKRQTMNTTPAISRNLVWKAIANAPEGFCHIRASSSGALLDDIEKGDSVSELRRKHSQRMSVLTYQMPTALPAAATVARAEKSIQELGLARSLIRQQATLSDLKKYWEPIRPVSPTANESVFGRVATRDQTPKSPSPLYDAKSVTEITLARFKSKILPAAEQIDILVPSIGLFVGFMRAAHADAAPILRWDRPTDRNTVSCYAMTINKQAESMSHAETWGLTRKEWAKVQALVDFPVMWSGHKYPEYADGSVFIIEGAHDESLRDSGLFPSDLLPLLHDFRGVISEYSRTTPPLPAEGGVENHAAGLFAVGATVRVRMQNVINLYHIDRDE